MNTSTHPVAPEEVMAFLDGELSAARSRAVSTHIEHCAECTNAADQFRKTSACLMEWIVAPPTSLLESTVLGATKGDKPRVSNALLGNLTLHRSYTVLARRGLGTVAVAILIAAGIPSVLYFGTARYKSVAQSRTLHVSPLDISPYVTKLPARASEPVGGSGEQMAGRPITDQQSKVFTNKVPSPPLDRIVTLNEPGIAADSNALFHGLGDHDKGSFSVNGQPGIGQLDGKVISGPMIARTVSLSIVVKDFPASRATLDIMLARHHGYSAQLTVSTPENAARGLQASLRIPAPELSSAVADLKTLGRVENESQSGEEVTQQHTDLVARLKTSRETEQRFRTILQQRTGNAVEVLQVEEGIARVRGDIERMEAEQKALEHRVDFAAVELQLSEEYKAQLNPPAASVSTRIHNSLVAGYRNAAETILGIVLFFAEDGPTLFLWLVILALPVFLIWRRYRRALATV